MTVLWLGSDPIPDQWTEHALVRLLSSNEAQQALEISQGDSRN
jgi:hypothetical protein